MQRNSGVRGLLAIIILFLFVLMPSFLHPLPSCVRLRLALRDYLFVLLLLLLWGTGAGRVNAKMRWYDPQAAAYPVVAGTGWVNELRGGYHRLPTRIEATVRPAVTELSHDAAGLSVAFRTNATEIVVRYTVRGARSMPHMPATGVSGVDLYTRDVNGNVRWCAGNFSFGDTITYAYRNLACTSRKEGDVYRLYLPLYTEVTWLEVGVNDGAAFRFEPLTAERPVVVYGTSIAHGACASRPGQAWTNIVARELDRPLVDLGFSGNGLLEPALFRALAEVDAAAYVIDCMPNMTRGSDPDSVYDRTMAGVAILRARRKAPILLVEHAGDMGSTAAPARGTAIDAANRALRRAYDSLRARGENDIYYLTRKEIGFTADAQVEGVHPNDIGMRQYADAYLRKLHVMLGDGTMPACFTARRQQRDSYDWNARHEAVLRLNAGRAPEIVMIGNSITHFWGGEPAASMVSGPESWKRLFGKRVVTNMGFGWDRIENVAWRIDHGELDGYQASKIFMMIGTNNLAHNADEEIVEGIIALTKLVQRHQPAARLYVLGILPRRDQEERIARINKALQGQLAGTGATYVDASQGLVTKDGRIDEKLFRDGLHPIEAGYALIAKQLKRFVTK